MEETEENDEADDEEIGNKLESEIPLLQNIKLEKEEIRTQNKIRKRKILQLKVHKPIDLHTLFPTRLRWKLTFTLYHLWNFVTFIVCVIVISVGIYLHVELKKSWQNLGLLRHDDDDRADGEVVLFCATVTPLISDDVAEYVGIPYASLPMGNSHFYKPGPLLSFMDCYKSYWVDLKAEQRKFDNGRLYFFSTPTTEPCKQISADKSQIVGTESCLTISLKSTFAKRDRRFKNFRSNKTKTLSPVVVYLTGRTYLENRPFLVGNSIVRRSKAIFVIVNYRLNVLGFSDFDLMKSPRNLGLNDFLTAMDFVVRYIKLFNGDRGRISLMAEESGATTGLINMLTKREGNIFTKLWLIDGSSFIPEKPARSLFYDLYSSKHILCNVHINDEDIFHCLQNFSSDVLLQNTPHGWLNANRYFFYLPNLFEERPSIIERVEDVVRNPLDVVVATGSNVLDVPIVLMSRIDFMPYWESSRFIEQVGNLTKKQLYTRTRMGLINYQTASSQVLYHTEINVAYKEYIGFVENRSIFKQYMNRDIIPLGFEEVFRAIISDLRSVCPYTAVAKYLQVNAHIVKGPIYRIIDGGGRFTGQSMESDRPCDLNFFLQDDTSRCISAARGIPKEYREALVHSFVSFINGDKIDGALQMEYPLNSSMKEFEDTFTFVGRLGFRTPGTREVGLLQACNVWKRGTDEFPMLKTSAKVN